MSKYRFNENSLSYEKVSFMDKWKPTIIVSLLFATLTMIFGMWVGYENADFKYFTNENGDVVLPTKHDLVVGSQPWIDSTFNEYARRADLYLSRPEYKGTPLSGDMMALTARNAYDSTGILLPVELALAQAQWESGMGLKGRSPKRNPYNIGEYDSGTVQWFETTFDGVQAYYYYMCLNYLKCRSIGELFVSFSNCSGHRYASAPEYEGTIANQFYYIRKWLDKNSKKAR